jgi:hypothetical protein
MNRISALGSLARKARTVFGATLLPALGLAAAALVATPASAQVTPSQTNSNQLNQLINSDVFSTTANHNAAGEAWVNGEFRFLKFPGDTKQYLFEVKGAYAFTDQITVGGWIPIYNTKLNDDSHTGLGDLTIFGQYKLDQLVNPDIINLSAQLDVLLGTGSRTHLQDTGHFGVRPAIQAYKNFGQVGPGSIGAYGVMAVTITTNSDFRFGLAGTYEWEKIVGILEFDDVTGDKHGRPTVTISPGVAYRGLNQWEFLVGVPLGVNEGSPDWGIVAKVTWALQK